MKLRFAVSLALRELRHGVRRVGVYMASITLGVATLVSIHSFRADVARSVQEEADVLMGANARLSDDQPFAREVEQVLDSLRDGGVGVARVTTATSRTGSLTTISTCAISPSTWTSVTTPCRRLRALMCVPEASPRRRSISAAATTRRLLGSRSTFRRPALSQRRRVSRLIPSAAAASLAV